MALSLAEVVDKIENLKHSRAIWLEVLDHLRIFVVDEVHKVVKGIESNGRPVPQSVVKEFVDRILAEEIGPMDHQIQVLEELSVEEKRNDEGKSAKKNTEEGSQGAKEERKAHPRDSAGKRAIVSGKKVLVS
jgi:hypothetical protein